MQLGTGETQQGGLACPVGAEHDPTLVELHPPVDGVEQGRGAPPHRHPVHPDHQIGEVDSALGLPLFLRAHRPIVPTGFADAREGGLGVGSGRQNGTL